MNVREEIRLEELIARERILLRQSSPYVEGSVARESAHQRLWKAEDEPGALQSAAVESGRRADG